MKMLKLFLAALFILAANVVCATGATVTNYAIGGYGGGTALLVVSGSNGSVRMDKSGTEISGPATSIATLENIHVIALVAQPNGGALSYSQCTVTVPAGATATVSYAASLPSTSTGSLSFQAGPVNYTATPGSLYYSSSTLPAGTYNLRVYGCEGQMGTGMVAQVSMQIIYPE
jgi:hypothetical protein